jgi:hypothetical protein
MNTAHKKIKLQNFREYKNAATIMNNCSMHIATAVAQKNARLKKQNKIK